MIAWGSKLLAGQIGPRLQSSGRHMSVAEIQDNKWEVQAAKVQLGTPGAIGMLIMMAAFVGFFVWVSIFSVIGMFTETSTMDFDKKQDVPAAEAPAAE
jgi:hypothetical protein